MSQIFLIYIFKLSHCIRNIDAAVAHRASIPALLEFQAMRRRYIALALSILSASTAMPVYAQTAESDDQAF